MTKKGVKKLGNYEKKNRFGNGKTLASKYQFF